jgi:DNA-binding NarL/FixJ family response regulator
MTANIIRLMVIDDHTILRQGLIEMLSLDPRIKLVAEASNATEALNEIKIKMDAGETPDVILLDLKMPGGSGLELLPTLRKISPDSAVVMLTMYGEEEFVMEAIKSGAAGYVLKDISREELMRTILAVHDGEIWFPRKLQKAVINEFLSTDDPLKRKNSSDGLNDSQGLIENLTDREQELLRLLADGASNRDISQKLNISENTVKSHLRHIYRKLNLEDRTQAAVFAIKNKL